MLDLAGKLKRRRHIANPRAEFAVIARDAPLCCYPFCFLFIMRHLLVLLFVASGAFLPLPGQNLIPNPSFEDHKKCPKGLGELDRVAEWTSANAGTPDFFHTCAPGRSNPAGVPNNYFSTQALLDGQAYTGIYAGEKETEYLQVRLLQPLEAGKRYCLRFFASPASSTSQQFARLKVWFRESAYTQSTWDPIDDTGKARRPDYQMAGSSSAWTLMSHSFEAQGGEQYLIVGYFGEKDRKGYTYLDGFGLYPYDSEAGCGRSYFSGNALQDDHNYVPNPGFEIKYGCPRYRAEMEMCAAWRVSENTPDFFHRCGTTTAAVPDNELGSQEPHTGDAYGGFWCYLQIRHDYREFISMRLQQPLEKGEVYCLSMWVSLAEISQYALHDLQMMPARAVDRIPSQVPVDDPRLVFLSDRNHPLDNREGWTQISALFIANGGEQFLTIGNFRENEDPGMVARAGGDLSDPRRPAKSSPAFKNSGYGEACYYYVDDVSLCRIDAPIADCPDDLSPQIVADPDDPKLFVHAPLEPETVGGTTDLDSLPAPPDWRAGDTLVLENFLFAFDARELAPEAKPVLDTLGAYLYRHPELRIAITGHTDDQGSETYNLQLSRARAEAVLAYLAQLGIAPTRLTATGVGEQQPLVPNDTEPHRAQNRRVEIRFF